jgi:hypothetical protein
VSCWDKKKRRNFILGYKPKGPGLDLVCKTMVRDNPGREPYLSHLKTLITSRREKFVFGFKSKPIVGYVYEYKDKCLNRLTDPIFFNNGEFFGFDFREFGVGEFEEREEYLFVAEKRWFFDGYFEEKQGLGR